MMHLGHQHHITERLIECISSCCERCVLNFLQDLYFFLQNSAAKLLIEISQDCIIRKFWAADSLITVAGHWVFHVFENYPYVTRGNGTPLLQTSG